MNSVKTERTTRGASTVDQRGPQTEQQTSVCTVGQAIEEAMEQTDLCTVVSREVHTVRQTKEQAVETDRQGRR